MKYIRPSTLQLESELRDASRVFDKLCTLILAYMRLWRRANAAEGTWMGVKSSRRTSPCANPWMVTLTPRLFGGTGLVSKQKVTSEYGGRSSGGRGARTSSSQVFNPVTRATRSSNKNIKPFLSPDQGGPPCRLIPAQERAGGATRLTCWPMRPRNIPRMRCAV